MCGIFVSACISSDKSSCAQLEEIQAVLKDQNAQRGPDAQNTVNFSIPLDKSAKETLLVSGSKERELVLQFYGSELRLRGSRQVIQPHLRDGDILCWNGEIFDGLQIEADENDGSKLFDMLCSLETPQQILDALSSIEGPYAMAFFHNRSKHLYFAQDPLGRRSLLIHLPRSKSPYFLLSSVSAGTHPGYVFEEPSTSSIFYLDIGSWRVQKYDIVDDFNRVLKSLPRGLTPTTATEFKIIPNVNRTLPPDDITLAASLDIVPEYLRSSTDEFIKQLDRSVKLRVQNIPQLASGKPKLAVLFSGGIDSTIITYLAHRHLPLSEPIDLLNVAFENPRKIKGNVTGVSRKRPAKDKTLEVLHNDDFKRYKVPDRMTGMDEVEELRRLCPGRIWNFVEVNVPYEVCQSARATVEALMVPGRTVMDLSLALALYFASRGQGQIRKSSDFGPTPYTSEARVLLNGLGSDELLGGYGRHRTAFETGQWLAVINELQLELDRIPTRNLGRDDRVISSHGKETRHPFLSLSLVSFLASLPIHVKMDPRLPPGFGDKMLLRFACRQLGLVEASSRKKRAMQFGSHSARMDGERRGDVALE
ncbi:asparagine synthase-domain-containing protein [Crepidotus variabilis]|uniref:Asparagine synthase-domain-containing protein n=1 Tax=Crepidotus variabilis TaxID=179855 RepID=A0A9P6EUL1_9AGAR|nr:asparagine synthase-domain-containing protein [Crepidotus variabilis]